VEQSELSGSNGWRCLQSTFSRCICKVFWRQSQRHPFLHSRYYSTCHCVKRRSDITFQHLPTLSPAQSKKSPAWFTRLQISIMIWILSQLGSSNNAVLVPVIAMLANFSFQEACFPDGAKIAIIMKPILKKPNLDPSDIKSWRPIGYKI